MPFDVARCNLYLCTPDRPDLEYFVSECIAGGVDIVQLREKNVDARALVGRATILQRVCTDRGVPFILNDRPDLALEVDADGVHVGQDDASVSLARRILGDEKIIGLSTHSAAEFGAGLHESVTYLSAGPIVATPTKPGREGTGLEFISVARNILGTPRSNADRLPFFVTGGITPAAIPGIAAAGGSRFVVVRYLTESDNPRHSARELRTAIDRAIESFAHADLHAKGGGAGASPFAVSRETDRPS